MRLGAGASLAAQGIFRRVAGVAGGRDLPLPRLLLPQRLVWRLTDSYWQSRSGGTGLGALAGGRLGSGGGGSSVVGNRSFGGKGILNGSILRGSVRWV